MSRNFGILLAAHGTLAQAALESLVMLMGPQKGIETVALFPNMGREELRCIMEEKLEVLAQYNKVLIVADLVGGTPANVAAELIAERTELQLVGGANMGFLCELAGMEELDEKVLAELLEAAHSGMQDLGTKLRSLLQKAGQELGLSNSASDL